MQRRSCIQASDKRIKNCRSVQQNKKNKMHFLSRWFQQYFFLRFSLRRWWRTILLRLVVARRLYTCVCVACYHRTTAPRFLQFEFRITFAFFLCCHHLFIFPLARVLIVLQYACGASHVNHTSTPVYFVVELNLLYAKETESNASSAVPRKLTDALQICSKVSIVTCKVHA